MRRVFVCFLEEIEDSKKAFRNYLTFKTYSIFNFWEICYLQDYLAAPTPQIFRSFASSEFLSVQSQIVRKEMLKTMIIDSIMLPITLRRKLLPVTVHAYLIR